MNFIEVCSGAGGLSTGLILAGLQPVLLNDIDPNCCKTLGLNHPDGVEIVCDSMDKIHVDKWIDKVDLLAGGVPCQSFSQAGLRKGLDDSRGELMFKFIDLIKKVRPKMFLIENVKGLLTHDKGNTLATILEHIHSETNNNYTIVYKLLNAWDYGVPQKRERVVIVGHLKGMSYHFPDRDPVEQRPVLKDVLTDVPDSDGQLYPEAKVQLFDQIPPGGCWVNLPEDLQRSYLGNSFASSGGKRGILYRLSMDRPSLTLLCSPSQKQTERCHPLESRPLKIREYARIQTFPDTYQFHGSLTSQYKQIGNAVPVELARRIGLSIIESLASCHNK